MSINESRIKRIISEDAEVKKLGLKVKYMCLSLACDHHRSLHGELFGFGEIKTIYALESVPDGCRCGVTQVLVDNQGNPMTPKVVELAKSQAGKKL